MTLTVRQDYGWQRWSKWWLVATTESNSGTIGLITLDAKCAGARNAGNPHVACDEAGAGNELTVWLVRHSQRKRGATDRSYLRSVAPVLDPTGTNIMKSIIW